MVSELAAVKGGSSKPVLPHLDKFSGKRDEFDIWIYAAEAKLHVDGHAIGDLEAQFYYLYSSLSPAVRRSVFAFAQVPANRTPAQLLEKFRVDYGEPNKDKKAAFELSLLKQKDKEPISKFLIRFEELFYRAKGNTWPDDAILGLLFSFLNDEWLKRLREYPEAPDKYLELCTYFRKFDGNYYFFGNSGQGSNSRSPAVYDVGGGEPIDFIATRVTESQRKRWKKKNACTACGSPNYWSKDCLSNTGGGSSGRPSGSKPATQIRYIRAEPDGGLEEDDDGDDYNKEDY